MRGTVLQAYEFKDLPEEPGSELLGQFRTRDVARVLLLEGSMDKTKLIAIRHLTVGGRVIPVELFRNDGGSVAARCILADADAPIIDGATADEAMAAVEDILEGVLLARGRST